MHVVHVNGEIIYLMKNGNVVVLRNNVYFIYRHYADAVKDTQRQITDKSFKIIVDGLAIGFALNLPNALILGGKL